MLDIINPANGLKIDSIASDTPQSIQEKLTRAQKSFANWQQSDYDSRAKIVRNFKELLKENVDQLAQVLTREMGKPIRQAKNEILATIPRIDFFLNHSKEYFQKHRVYEEQGLQEIISYEPLGMIANISAWNYPYFVGSNVFIPALLCANIIFYKPSEYSSLTGLAIAELWQRAGLPEDVFFTIIGDGQIGNELLNLPLAGVFFTGSYATGKAIAQKVAGRMKIQMELGGKDPVYVAEDVDVEKAAIGLADGAFYNTGQSCCSVERIYVHKEIYESFLQYFTEEVKTYTIGDPLEKTTYIAPLARTAQIDVLLDQVEDARSKGARVLLGGQRIEKKGNYFSPTIIADARADMKVMQEESFGPIIGIAAVENDEQAIAEMNHSKYGLTAGVFTTCCERAQKILRQINSGTVYWNCCDRVSPNLPWSGRNQSGMGVTLSKMGIETFLQPKAWHMREP